MASRSNSNDSLAKAVAGQIKDDPIECSICGQIVQSYLLMEHVDSGCKEHVIVANIRNSADSLAQAVVQQQPEDLGDPVECVICNQIVHSNLMKQHINSACADHVILPNLTNVPNEDLAMAAIALQQRKQSNRPLSIIEQQPRRPLSFVEPILAEQKKELDMGDPTECVLCNQIVHSNLMRQHINSACADHVIMPDLTNVPNEDLAMAATALQQRKLSTRTLPIIESILAEQEKALMLGSAIEQAQFVPPPETNSSVRTPPELGSAKDDPQLEETPNSRPLSHQSVRERALSSAVLRNRALSNAAASNQTSRKADEAETAPVRRISTDLTESKVKIILTAEVAPDEENDKVGNLPQKIAFVRAMSQESLYDMDTIDRQAAAQRMMEHPSRFYQVYADRDAKDASCQTDDKYMKPKRGGISVALPSELRYQFDFLRNIDEDEFPENGAGFLERTMQNTLAPQGKMNHVRISAELINRGESAPMDELLPESQAPAAAAKKKLKFDIDNKRAKMSPVRRFVYDLYKKVQRKRREIKKTYGLWNKHLRFIESRFGTGIVKYFALYRWVFTVNLWISFFWFVFVLVIGLFDMAQDNYAGWAGTTDVLTSGGKYPVDGSRLIGDFFAGGPAFNGTFFFINGYKAKIGFNSSVPYDMDIAYMAIILLMFVWSFVSILRRMKALYSDMPLTGGNGRAAIEDVAPFATAVFCGWDYAITDPRAHINHNFALATIFKTLISKIEIDKKKVIATQAHIRTEVIVRRVLTNFIVLFVWWISGLLIYITLGIEYNVNLDTSLGIKVDQRVAASIRSNGFISVTVALISTLNLILPYLFKRLAQFEMYVNPTVEASVTLARSYVTKIAAIYLIFGALLASNKFNDADWEYTVGQSFYQLIWSNMFITIASTLAHGFFTKFTFGREHYEFPLADNILDVIYRQALYWVGCIYSPAVALTSLIAGVSIFFVKKFTLVHCGLPPRRIYNSYTQNYFFLFFLLVTLCLVALPVFYTLAAFPPKQGPYGPSQQSPPMTSSLDIIGRTVQSLNNSFFREMFTFFGSSGFIVPLVIVLSIWIYFLRAMGEKRAKLVKSLTYEVLTERADKKFLLRYYKVKM